MKLFTRSSTKNRETHMKLFTRSSTKNRGSCRYSHLTVRGDNLGSVKDGLCREHLPQMFSAIKKERLRIEDDQIPS